MRTGKVRSTPSTNLNHTSLSRPATRRRAIRRDNVYCWNDAVGQHCSKDRRHKANLKPWLQLGRRLQFVQGIGNFISEQFIGFST